MSAIHVIVRPRPEQAPEPALAPLYGLFDVIVDGVNLTARIGDGQALSLLAELGQAVAQLSAGRRERATVQLYADDEAWELGLETDGQTIENLRRRPQASGALWRAPRRISARLHPMAARWAS